MTKDEALRMALEALEAHADIGIKSDKAITAIQEALVQPEPTPEQLAALGWQSIECPFCGTSGAQAFPKPETDWEGIAADQAMTIALLNSEQEPVGSLNITSYKGLGNYDFDYLGSLDDGTYTLYSSPPKREWVGLTEKDRLDCLGFGAVRIPPGWREVIGAIDDKLKELNHDN